jgi:hypothetical protein
MSLLTLRTKPDAGRTNRTRVADRNPPSLQPTAEILRDIAFVLQAARKVRRSMTKGKSVCCHA